ncbi:hypothetical protein F511_00437 [Dorcoceras hygrometricum]|uniref:Uncharacterized protein n=1 Tax=Dorcoceras hygrometricum TaxID=472368 RepID=A0A2Z7BAV5_9LAMI|nr:hypothetical protein F511_00437 [Dorcoceras hygrometricum]
MSGNPEEEEWIMRNSHPLVRMAFVILKSRDKIGGGSEGSGAHQSIFIHSVFVINIHLSTGL